MTALGKVDEMPLFWEKSPVFDLRLRVKRNVWLVFVTDHGIVKSVTEEPLKSGFLSSLRPATRSLWLRSSPSNDKEIVMSRRGRNKKAQMNIFI